MYVERKRMMETAIFGPPGTGKTTTLIDIIKKSLKEGMDPTKIAFMSFSRKAATEARDRSAIELGLDVKQMLYFRTLHSLAFTWLGLDTKKVFKGSDYHDLGKLVGLEFRSAPTVSLEEGPLFQIGAGGDKYMSLVQMARVREVSLEQQFNDAWDSTLHWQQLKVLDNGYRDYKKAKNKLDFVDMIEKFIEQGTSPKFDLLIIDEAQDLAPLQWRMVKEVLVPNSKRVYYAGDDDQAIYTWMGVKVSDFLNSCDDKLFLTKSFRVPSAVHDFSQNLIKKVSTRQTKNWQPTKKDGTITWHRDILDVDLTSGEWLVLARTNYITNKVCNRLKEDGYLYWREGTGWSISPNVINGIEVWLKLCKNQSLSTVELKNFSKILSPNVISRSGRKLMSSLDAEQTYTLNDIIEKCSLNASHETPWQKVLKVSDQETAYIMSVRRRGERILTGTPRIRISTIHKAKGGEADNVALLLDSTKACVESLDQDSEIRTFYVGATRAKKTLHLIESNALHRFNI
jgi:superfamily I DNA/RNA helicase|tara:strand:+ start:2852 stop:4390 length:1539 start_codon:yes stop_codon:yes gene_type:complete